MTSKRYILIVYGCLPLLVENTRYRFAETASVGSSTRNSSRYVIGEERERRVLLLAS